MTHPTLKTLALCSLFSVVSLATGLAKEYKVNKEEPIATITLPDDWKVEQEAASLDARTKEEGIILFAWTDSSETVDASIKECDEYLEKEGVKLDKKTMVKTEAELNGMKVIDVSFDGKDKEGDCKVSFTVIHVTDKEAVSLLYWASPEEEKKHEKELGEIIHSIKKAAK